MNLCTKPAHKLMTGKESGHIDHEAGQAVPALRDEDRGRIRTRWKWRRERRMNSSRAGFRSSLVKKKSARRWKRRLIIAATSPSPAKTDRRSKDICLTGAPARRCKNRWCGLYPKNSNEKIAIPYCRHRRPGIHRTRYRRRQELGSLDEEICREEGCRAKPTLRWSRNRWTEAVRRRANGARLLARLALCLKG